MKDIWIALIQQNKFWTWLTLLTVAVIVVFLFHFNIITVQTFIDLYKFTVSKFQNFKLL
jgi:nitrate/TMAO reductase-like tetraheme cytochrome c subunit